MKKQYLGFATPIVIGAIILVVILATATYLLSKPKIEPQDSSVSQSTPTSSLSSPNSNETANWKTYSDSDGKFSVKYPQEWITNRDNNRLVISGDNNSITIQTSPYPSITFDTLYEKPDGTIDQNPVFIRTKIKNLEIDGYKATMYTNESTPANQNKAYDISVYTVRGAPITMISAQVDLNSKSNFLPIFEQILSTIKFSK